MIKLYTGPMFSGKSDELLKEYDKKYHKSKILSIDYPKNFIFGNIPALL